MAIIAGSTVLAAIVAAWIASRQTSYPGFLDAGINWVWLGLMVALMLAMGLWIAREKGDSFEPERDKRARRAHEANIARRAKRDAEG